MIFVTVGNEQRYPFTRFIRIIDEIAHDITDEVVMQIGSASYEPKNCTYFPFVPHQEYMEVFGKSRLIVSHCATGVIIHAIRLKKPIILFPRRAGFNEHVDNHQVDTAKSVEDRKGVWVAYDEEALREVVMTFARCGDVSDVAQKTEETRIIETIAEFLSRLRK